MPETQSATPTSELTSDLRELAADVVRRAMATGASAAEAVVQEGDEFSTVVRLGEVETLKEAGSRALGVRLFFFGQRTASTYTSDLSLDGVAKLVSSHAIWRGSLPKTRSQGCPMRLYWDSTSTS